MIERLSPELFDWLTWRNGSIWNVFKIPHRTIALLENANLIREYAIGYAKADHIPCRQR